MTKMKWMPLILLAGCGGGGKIGEDGSASISDLAGPPPDLASVADLAAQDLAEARDLSTATTPDLVMLAMDMSRGYPAGPYGSNVGDTIAPLAWEGYVNPTAMGLASSKPYGAYSMDDLRRSGNKFALIYAADFW